jgi:hypothetical protein
LLLQAASELGRARARCQGRPAACSARHSAEWSGRSRGRGAAEEGKGMYLTLFTVGTAVATFLFCKVLVDIKYIILLKYKYIKLEHKIYIINEKQKLYKLKKYITKKLILLAYIPFLFIMSLLSYLILLVLSFF